MKFHDFLSHHGIQQNPFSVEDAHTDSVFKEFCIDQTFHPAWDKVLGNPADPSTAIVFGEKGAGKTALRLQTEMHIAKYNRQHPQARCFVIAYDNFNPFLDQFKERFGSRTRAERLFREFRLWDHLDAILSLGVTQLIDRLFSPPENSLPRSEWPSDAIERDFRKRLRGHQRRDLLLLAACYDHSSRASHLSRWFHLQRKLSLWNSSTWWPFLVGFFGTWGILGLLWIVSLNQEVGLGESLLRTLSGYRWLWFALFLGVWTPWLLRVASRLRSAWRVARNVRVIPRRTWALVRMLMNFSSAQLDDQPLPDRQRTDDRYSLLDKFQSILRALGFHSIVVLVDRIDEPHLINGSPEWMRLLLWPMLDNKFLKQPGLGIKLMLPSELYLFVDRETQEFYQRARLDKQNVIPSLNWTGEALFDVTNARIAAVSSRKPAARLTDLVDESIEEHRLFEALRSLRVPRHVFRFLYRLISTHCNQHSESNPCYRISSDTFESELSLFRRDLEAAQRGLSAG